MHTPTITPVLSQDVWVDLRLLAYWHQQRMATPGSSTVTAMQTTLAEYQRDVLCSPELTKLNATMLGNVYAQYVEFLKETHHALDEVKLCPHPVGDTAVFTRATYV